MAAKLLHSLADDNPDLQKQIGCMTGIFQLFDRQQILTGKRLNHKRLPPPPGDSHFNNSSLEREHFNVRHQRTARDMKLNKSLTERQRISTESSGASFSSSCSSSLSSLDCMRPAQPEANSFDRIVFPETPSRDPVISQLSTSPRLSRQSLDLRDVVKDSMYREARGLPVKTSKKDEPVHHLSKSKDSPRPLELSQAVDGSYRVGNNGKQSVPADFQESLRVLAKLRDAPWNYNETREHPRSSSYEPKDRSWHTMSKDAPRFSYDGREITRLSFESQDTIKSSTPKLKELPRLSLDSREFSMRSSNFDSKTNYLSKNLQDSGHSSEHIHNRPPSVVAKLMGLEPLPDSTSSSRGQLGLIETSLVGHGDSFSRSLKELNKSIRVPKSPRSSMKEPISPRWKNPDLIVKPVSRLPLEPAPWKQPDGSRGSQKSASKPGKVSAKAASSFPSVYGEIENRLKDLEFKESGKNLRALKQILEAMQAKGLLDGSKEEQGSNFGTRKDFEPKYASPSQKSRLQSQRNPQSNHVGASTARTYDSPIVIMKPAKLVEKSRIPSSSVIPIDNFSDLHKIPSGGHADSKRGSVSNQAKYQSHRNSHRESVVNTSDKRTGVWSTKMSPSLTRTQQVPKESATSSVKISGSVSPRLQQKKLEFEKRSRPPTPPSDSNKPRRQSNQQTTDAGSPGGRRRLKSHKLPQSDDQLSQISNESRTSSHQGDDASLQSDSTTVLDLKTDIEVTSSDPSAGINNSQSPSIKAATHLMQKKPSSTMEEDGPLTALAVISPEHPSPVSVLDTSVYRDDALSPVKQTPNMSTGDVAQDNNPQNEDQWKQEESLFYSCVSSRLTSEINRKKLQNVENLVQKLTRLNSTHDEASTDYIASLCENTSPDHRYISEILLASGLLLRDLGSGLATFQLHPSGHPINPELFFVLEQTKSRGTLPLQEECSPSKTTYLKQNHEKFHRKLIFDAVNEILVKKLSLLGISHEPCLKSDKLVKKTLSAQKLLKELCSEIEHLQVKKPGCSLGEEDDGLKGILWDDVMCRSENWTDFQNEVSGAVLDIERLIFKDLVDEIVIGESAGLRTKPTRRRQQFAKQLTKLHPQK